VPIVGLTDVEGGLPKLVSIRLGEPIHDPRTGQRLQGKRPSEHDHFALTPEDGATPEMLQLWGRTPKQLRILLHEEFDYVPPGRDEEVVMSAYNRAYQGAAGLVCRGTGNDRTKPGIAWTSNEEWATRICAVTRSQPEYLPDGRIQMVCPGRGCPKWFKMEKGEDGKMRRAPGTDRDSACRHTLVFRFYLVHPCLDYDSPDYLRILGGAQLASSSVNTIRDLFAGMREVLRHTRHPKWGPEGRTRAIPLTLIRKRTWTGGGGVGRVPHWTIQILPTIPEWERAALMPPDAVFISVPQRAAILQALRDADEYFVVRDLVDGMNHERRRIGMPAAEVPDDDGDVETTQDVRRTVVDAREPRALTTSPARAAQPRPAEPEPEAEAATDPVRWELSEATYEQRVAELTDEQLARRLSKGEREVVKANLAERMGRDPKDTAVVLELQELIKAAHAALGTAPPEGLTVSSMTVGIELWIRAHLPRPQAAEAEDEPVEAEAESDDGEEAVAAEPEVQTGSEQAVAPASDAETEDPHANEAPSMTLPGLG
jgi:Recombination directionality factor-like